MWYDMHISNHPIFFFMILMVIHSQKKGHQLSLFYSIKFRYNNNTLWNLKYHISDLLIIKYKSLLEYYKSLVFIFYH